MRTKLHCILLSINIVLLLFISHHTLNGNEISKTNEENDISSIENGGRKLSLDYDLFTEEKVKTFNGVPPRTSCPLGYWRNGLNGGPREDGCVKCGRGRYGSSTGLTSETCTGNCPRGKYSFKEGITSESECFLCPLGRFGRSEGLKSAECSGRCPAGKYTSTTGNDKLSACKPCLPGYRGYQCTWAINPRAGVDHDNADDDEIFGT